MKIFKTAVLLFFFCLPAAAQDVSYLPVLQKAQQTLNKYRTEQIQKKISLPPSWFWFADENQSRQFIDRHKYIFQDNPDYWKAMFEIFDKSAVSLFGENHTNPVPRYKTLFAIMVYNERYPDNRVTDIFLERSPVMQEFLELLAKRLKPFKTLKQKDDFCWSLYDLEKNYFEATDVKLCQLIARGVNIYAADLDTCYPENGKACCGIFGARIAGTDLLPIERDGVSLRNCAIWNKMKEIISKRGGKFVFFGGSAHIGCGATNSTVTLNEIISADFPDLNIYTVIHEGGKEYDKQNYEIPAVCENCASVIARKGDNLNIKTVPVTDWRKFADKEKIVFIYLGEGLKKENPGMYKDRPADFVIVYPPDMDY
ncbi:MAG: hypothetical protein LBI01_02940 [Elusimicrobium sp.]|jgi:hypothetical protein|nr:hypothetical protein [Elusimicrobium sp.]